MENIVTDKWPLNFQYIGFIFKAFPDAKIIHLNREPIATAGQFINIISVTKEMDGLITWKIYQSFISYILSL